MRTILPSCSPASRRSCAARVSLSGNTVSITGFARPDVDEVETASKSRARAHRRAVDRQLLPPHPVQVRRRVRSGRRAAHAHAAGGTAAAERRLPGVGAHRLDDDVHAAVRQLLHARRDVLARVVHRRVGAELARAFELLVGRRRDDGARAERLRDREGRRGDAAADPPDQHPLVGLQAPPSSRASATPSRRRAGRPQPPRRRASREWRRRSSPAPRSARHAFRRCARRRR